MNRHSNATDPTGLTVDGLALNGARWLLLAALVFAPWAYGGVDEWAIEAVNGTMAVVAALWLFVCLLRQSLPAIPRALAISAFVLTGYAWFMALNAKSDYNNTAREWVQLTSWLPALPGSVHQSASFTVARRISALFVAVCFACEMARRSVWRERLLWTLAGNGTALVLFGLVQRLASAPAVFWGDYDSGESFFASYRYHSNAGAFINLSWPMVAGFVTLAFLRGASWTKRLAWSVALLICLVGAVVNASRAASVLALILGACWIAWLMWQSARGRIHGVLPSVAGVTGGLLLLLIVGLATMAGLDTTAKRWGKFGREFSMANPRLEVAGACLEMIPESGWFGFGPGSWEKSFPFFSHGLRSSYAGVWEHAHNDYLETIIDWGFVGAVGWVLVILGGVAGSCVQLWRKRGELGDPERVVHFAVVSALLGMLLHSLVDFPLQIISLQLPFATLLGMTWASRHWLRGEEPAPPRRHHRRSVTPAVAMDGSPQFSP